MATAVMTGGLGLKIFESAQKCTKDFDDHVTDIYTWIDQYIADAKKTFNTWVLLFIYLWCIIPKQLIKRTLVQCTCVNSERIPYSIPNKHLLNCLQGIPEYLTCRVRTVHEKTDRTESNFTSPGSVDSVPDPVMRNGNATSHSCRPPKETCRHTVAILAINTLCCGWRSCRSLSLIPASPIMHYVRIQCTTLTIETRSWMAWPSMNNYAVVCCLQRLPSWC